MRITVRSSDTNFNLWLPTRLLLNPVTAAIVAFGSKHATKYVSWETISGGHLSSESGENPITFNNMRKLFVTIRRCRRVLKGQPLVSVRSHDGDNVDIWL